MIDLNPEAGQPDHYILPHPMRHLIGWLFRKRVYAEDAVRNSSYKFLHHKLEAREQDYFELREYLNGIAREHTPIVWDADRIDVSVFHPTLKLVCQKCQHMWPCPSWKLATRRDYPPVEIRMEPRDD